MMARRKIVAGNIKMFLSRESLNELLRGVWGGLPSTAGADVLYFPPFTLLPSAAALLYPVGGTPAPIGLGGQNMHWEVEGAFTGEISPRHLLDVGCGHVLIGHSERRTLFGETDGTVQRKLRTALTHGLAPMVCIGETLAEREGGQMEDVLGRQVEAALEGVSAAEATAIRLAYEPVWAIGTGKTATPEMAQDAHRFIRGRVAARLGEAVAAAMPILYGGSVKADNAAGLMSRPDIDGALVGGACLAHASFLAIVGAAQG